jgi:hypothetical protein
MKNKIVMTLVAIVLVGGGVFWLMGKDKDDTKSTNNSTSANNTSQEQKPTEADNGLKLMAQTVGQQADCSTYNFSELQKIWGVPFVDTDINKVSQLSTSGGKLYSCTYNETDSGQGATFAIEYREHPSVDSAKQSIADTLSTEKYGDKVYYIREDIAGVGDQAFHFTQNTDNPKNRQMFVRKGNVVFMLSGVNLAGASADYKDKLKASYLLHFN